MSTNNIITIGGTSKFTNKELAFEAIPKILKKHKINTKDLIIYGYEDSVELLGAYGVAEAWAKEKGIRFESGQVKRGDGSFTDRKNYRDETLANVSRLLINLRIGNQNGGLNTIKVFEGSEVPVEVVDEAPEFDTSTLTPAQKRKGELPSAEELAQSVAVYSQVAKRLIESRALMLDTETTGTSTTDEVIELAIGDTYSRTILYNSLIKSPVKINPEASKVNGITADKLKKAPNIGEVWQTVDAIVGNRIVIASHSVSGVQWFDWRLLNQSLARHGLLCTFLWFDLQPLYRMYSCQTSESKFPLKTEGMCLQMGVTPGEHSAADDIRAQMDLLHAMANGVVPDFTI